MKSPDCLSVYVCVCLSVCLSVCVFTTNNFWTDQWIFMKFGRQVLPFKVTSMQ
jgi:hypothetical protein